MPWGSDRAHKPPKARNTKKIRKIYQIPHPGWGLENQKKITEKKTNMVIFGPLFVFISVISSYSRGPTRFRVQETVLLVNHALARGTPAIFVIFVVSRVRAAKPLFYWLECRFVIFAIFVKNPLFLVGQKHGLPKAPFSGLRPVWGIL